MTPGPQWPAFGEDGAQSGNDECGSLVYTGFFHYGALFAIHPDVDINSLGLSPDGLKIARALQQYGGYITDRSCGRTLVAETTLEDRLGDARQDWPKLMPYLREVTNSGPNSIGGGN